MCSFLNENQCKKGYTNHYLKYLNETINAKKWVYISLLNIFVENTNVFDAVFVLRVVIPYFNDNEKKAFLGGKL